MENPRGKVKEPGNGGGGCHGPSKRHFRVSQVFVGLVGEGFLKVF